MLSRTPSKSAMSLMRDAAKQKDGEVKKATEFCHDQLCEHGYPRHAMPKLCHTRNGGIPGVLHDRSRQKPAIAAFARQVLPVAVKPLLTIAAPSWRHEDRAIVTLIAVRGAPRGSSAERRWPRRRSAFGRYGDQRHQRAADSGDGRQSLRAAVSRRRTDRPPPRRSARQ